MTTLASLLLCLPLLGGPEVRWSAPSVYVTGMPFQVEIEVEAPEGGCAVAGWMLTPAAFTLDGKPVGTRQDSGTITLPAGYKLSGRVDLGPFLQGGRGFQLAYANELSDSGAIDVAVLSEAPSGLDFLKMPAAELGGYQVLLVTNRGDIRLALWPDVAPQHVRNFLDLAFHKFYDGTTFHRVMKGFMIQGGDPTGSGTGDGPRQIALEKSDRKHVRGVLSMARKPDPNSASCQFFIVHGQASHLDGQYSAFGKVVSGMDTVDRIAETPVGAESRPLEPQRIVRAIVVLAPGE